RPSTTRTRGRAGLWASPATNLPLSKQTGCAEKGDGAAYRDYLSACLEDHEPPRVGDRHHDGVVQRRGRRGRRRQAPRAELEPHQHGELAEGEQSGKGRDQVVGELFCILLDGWQTVTIMIAVYTTPTEASTVIMRVMHALSRIAS